MTVLCFTAIAPSAICMVKLLFQHGETPRTYQAARRTIWRRAVRDRSQVAGLIGKLTSTGNNQFTNCDLLWFRPTRIVSFCSSLEDRSEQRLKTQGIGSSEANRHRLASVNLPDKQFRDRFRAVFLLSVVISHDSSAKDHARRNARDGHSRPADLLLGLQVQPQRGDQRRSMAG